MSAPPAPSNDDVGRRLDLHPPDFVGFYRVAMADVVQPPLAMGPAIADAM